MAVVSALRSAEGPVLILCPSDALVEQLIAEVQEKFWERIGADSSWHLPDTVRLYPSSVTVIAETLDKYPEKKHVVVSTIQALQQIHASSTYDRLISIFSTVMFDEGHREPAPLWATAVRGLNAPTILFSATPYRNDYKLFQIDSDFISFLSFQQACEAGIIRQVEFIERELSESPLAFAREVIAARDGMVHDS